MFYENDRIVRKQRRYLNDKANEMLSNFRSKKLKSSEIIAALELLLDETGNTETHVDIVNRAINIMKNSGEIDG